MFESVGWLVVWPVLVPILGAALAAVAWGNGRAQAMIGVFGLGAQLLASIALFTYVWTDGVVAMSMGGWQAPFGIALAADTFGAGLTMVGSLVGLIVAIHSIGTTDEAQRRAGFFPLLLALMAGVAGAFLTSDIFNLYVWFEVTLISSFGLIVLGGATRASRRRRQIRFPQFDRDDVIVDRYRLALWTDRHPQHGGPVEQGRAAPTGLDT